MRSGAWWPARALLGTTTWVRRVYARYRAHSPTGAALDALPSTATEVLLRGRVSRDTLPAKPTPSSPRRRADRAASHQTCGSVEGEAKIELVKGGVLRAALHRRHGVGVRVVAARCSAPGGKHRNGNAPTVKPVLVAAPKPTHLCL